MSNMSYCRFRNTSSDLADCLEALQYGEADLSSEERSAAGRMFKDFLNFCEDNGLCSFDDDDEAAVDRYLDKQCEKDDDDYEEDDDED